MGVNNSSKSVSDNGSKSIVKWNFRAIPFFISIKESDGHSGKKHKANHKGKQRDTVSGPLRVKDIHGDCNVADDKNKQGKKR